MSSIKEYEFPNLKTHRAKRAIDNKHTLGTITKKFRILNIKDPIYKLRETEIN